MKKFLSLLLALTMMLSLSITAFAADTSPKTVASVTEGSNTASFDVTGTVTVNEEAYADVVYSVLVEWTVAPLALVVNKTQPYTWDPATLRYVPGTADSDPDSFEAQDVEVTITLTNSSNAAVNYTVAYADNATDGLTTSEAAAADNVATGKLANADITAAASALTEGDYDYAIDTEKVESTGEAKTASYAGTVSLTDLGETSAIENGSTLTLGTYTVTLGVPGGETA